MKAVARAYSFRAMGEPLDLGIVQIDPNHGVAQAATDLSQDLRVAVMSDGLDDGPSALGGVAALEDAGADEDAVAAELHHEGGVGGGGDAAGGELDDGEAAELLGLHDEVVGGGEVLGEGEDLVVVHVAEEADVGHDGADVADGLDDVAGAGLALGADHGGALADAAEGLAEVAAAADEGDAEVVLVDVVGVVRWGQNLALVHVVDSDGLQDLGLHEVPDAGLRHHRDGHRLLYLLYELRVAHSGHPALGPDVCWHTLQGHDRARPCLLRDAGLLRVHHVHYHPSPQHLGQAHFYREGRLLCLRDCSVAVYRYHTGSFHGDKKIV